MKKLIGYFQSILYNIKQNKLYALFYIGGTALTFIFVVLILQFIKIFITDYPPLNDADRIIRLDIFHNTEGRELRIAHSEVNAFMENLKDFDGISLYHNNAINILVNEQVYSSMVGFVNADFWKIYTFKFMYGGPFTKEDCTHRKAVAVITEKTARSFFNTTNCIGKKFTFQRNEYEVTGVVNNFSFFSTPTDMCTIWVPYVFDKFIPNGTYSFAVDIRMPKTENINISREKIFSAIQYYFQGKNEEIDLTP
ncbi:MAG: ABC transporter permease [Candidatus Azobacteroides sp.]|nr:ABC transporter permease [Candidatus Azobacteroides sp.]